MRINICSSWKDHIKLVKNKRILYRFITQYQMMNKTRKYKGGNQVRVEYSTVKPKRVFKNFSPIIIDDTTMAFDFIEYQDVSVIGYLQENSKNMAFHFNGQFYLTNKDRLLQLCNDGNSVKYKCKKIYEVLFVSSEMYDLTIPYLLGNSFGCPCGLIELSKLKTVINTPHYRIIKIVDYVPPKTGITTVSLQMFGEDANASSASHCQAGQGESIRNLEFIQYTPPILPNGPVVVNPPAGIPSEEDMNDRLVRPIRLFPAFDEVGQSISPIQRRESHTPPRQATQRSRQPRTPSISPPRQATQRRRQPRSPSNSPPTHLPSSPLNTPPRDYLPQTPLNTPPRDLPPPLPRGGRSRNKKTLVR